MSESKRVLDLLQTEFYQLLESLYEKHQVMNAGNPTVAELRSDNDTIAKLIRLHEIKTQILHLKNTLVEPTNNQAIGDTGWLKRQIDKLNEDQNDWPEWLRASSGKNAELNSPNRTFTRKEILEIIDKPTENDNWLLERMDKAKEEVASWKPWMRDAMGILDDSITPKGGSIVVETTSIDQKLVDERFKLIYDILWDMNWFGNFGVRKSWLSSQLEKLKALVKK